MRFFQGRQKEIEDQKRRTKIYRTDGIKQMVINNFPKQKAPGQDGFTDEF